LENISANAQYTHEETKAPKLNNTLNVI
jgi:hypothetical protein